MAFNYPYGDTQQLNLNWFLSQWETFREQWATAEEGIDHALDAEIARVEAAMTDLYAARDAAAASKTAAQTAATNAASSETVATQQATLAQSYANTAQTQAGIATAAAEAAGNSASSASTSATAANLSKTQAANSATAAQTAQTAAAGSASNAADSATAAAGSASNAADSATAASGSASSAADSATAAAASAASLVVDSAMSDSSTNPVQNKVINGEITELKNALSYKVIYPTLGIINASVNASTGKISNNANCRTIYFDALPNTNYKITKASGSRFAVGWSNTTPARDEYLSDTIADNTGTALTIKTGNTAKYVAAFCYYESGDTSYTADEMLDTVQIFQEQPNKVLLGNEWVLQKEGKSIYDSAIYPFYEWLKRLPTTGTSQGLVYDNAGNVIVFFSNGLIRKYNKYGVELSKTQSVFSHPHAVETLPDGKILVTSSEDYGTEQEVRKMYFYDFSTNTVTDSFTPTVTGNLVFASQIDADDYYLITWIGSSNVLYFYSYVRSTDTATEIGHFTASRTFLQGGCRIGNIWYLIINNGGNNSSLLITVDATNITVLNTITFDGFGEVEGFSLQCDDNGNLNAIFTENSSHQIYMMRLR